MTVGGPLQCLFPADQRHHGPDKLGRCFGKCVPCDRQDVRGFVDDAMPRQPDDGRRPFLPDQGRQRGIGRGILLVQQQEPTQRGKVYPVQW